MDDNDKWAQIIDDGERSDERIEVEVCGEWAGRIDRRWKSKLPLELAPEFPAGYGPPPPEEEWRKRTVTTVRLSKEGGSYWSQKVVRTIYEIKPEVIIP